jgi:hypothetical protein
MNDIPIELLEIFVSLCPSKTRMFLCQVNKLFLKICIANTTTSFKSAILSRDIYSLVRLKSLNKQFLNTAQLKNYIVNLLMNNPDARILAFLLDKYHISLQFNIIHKIYFKMLTSKQHFKMANKFINYTTKNQGRSGMTQSATLYNSTRNIIPINNNFSQFDLNIVCATGCSRTIQTMLGVPTYRNEIFKKIEVYLVIATYFNHTDIIKILIKSANIHYSVILIEDWVKRAILVAIACHRQEIFRILTEYCPQENAYRELNYEDAQYYIDYERLIYINVNHTNLINILSILVYKDDPLVESYIKVLLDTNDEMSMNELIGEMLLISTKHNKIATSLVLINYITNPRAIEEFLEPILFNMSSFFNLTLLEKIMPIIKEMPIHKNYVKNYNKIKKIKI